MLTHYGGVEYSDTASDKDGDPVGNSSHCNSEIQMAFKQTGVLQILKI